MLMLKLMLNFNLTPRVEITHLPTAIKFLPQLYQSLKCNVYFKRGDCTGFAAGVTRLVN